MPRTNYHLSKGPRAPTAFSPNLGDVSPSGGVLARIPGGSRRSTPSTVSFTFWDLRKLEQRSRNRNTGVSSIRAKPTTLPEMRL